MKPLVTAFACALLLSACNPLYVLRASYEEMKILSGREDIRTLIARPDTAADVKHKLHLVLAARGFAESLGLDVGETFTKYTEVETKELLWVLMAAKVDSFTLKEWWFPVVGAVPYKGFFDKEDALTAAKQLEQEGYETHIRSADAFSTLGWFNDPVLSTTLENPPHQVVNIILHESLHSTVWIPNAVAFNESVANFFGLAMAVRYYTREKRLCAHSCTIEKNAAIERNLAAAQSQLTRNIQYARALEALFLELESVYQSTLSRADKLQRKEALFQKHARMFKEKYSISFPLRAINNAALMQSRVYLREMDLFSQALHFCREDTHCFLKLLKNVTAQAESDAFTALARLIEMP